MNSSFASSPAVSTVRYSAAACEVAACDEGARQSRAQIAVLGVQMGRRPEHFERRVVVPPRLEGRGQPLELIRRRGTLAGACEIASSYIDIQQALTDFVVIRRKFRRPAQRFDGLVDSAFLDELGRDFLEIAHGAGDVIDLHAGAWRRPCDC